MYMSANNGWTDTFTARSTMKTQPFTLAPDWYVAAINKGADEKELYALVKVFCHESTGQEPEEILVKLMIDNYEAEAE